MSDEVAHELFTASSSIKAETTTADDCDATGIDVFSLLSNGAFDMSNDDDKNKLKKPFRNSKKSSEIWDHYKLLSENQNVECIYCWKILKRSDSSTKSMWGHMNAYHQEILSNKMCRKRKRVAVGNISMNENGVEKSIASQEASSTPTQPYVKRVRAGGSVNQSNGSSQRKSFSPANTSDNTFSLALQQMNSMAGVNNSLSFLDNIQKTTEIINIPVGFGTSLGEDDEQPENGEAGSSSVSASDERAASGSPMAEENQTAGSGGSPSVTSTNQLSAFMNMAANPLMWNAMLSSANSSSGNNSSSSGCPFTLNDGSCITILMKMAIDLDLTMSYHKRRSDIELCFESNRTAEKSGGRGKIVCLSDLGREIRVTERVNGTATDAEMWTKTDFNQFHWAIRGKCQKLLVKQ